MWQEPFAPTAHLGVPVLFFYLSYKKHIPFIGIGFHLIITRCIDKHRKI